MTTALEEIEKRLGDIKFNNMIELDILKLATTYAGTHYLEIQNEITNERIDRLQAGSSFTEQMLWLAIGGVGGLAVSAIAKKITGKMLANHLTYVRVRVKAKASKTDRDKIRKFFKISKKGKFKIRVNQLLNPESTAGRLHRYLPELIGSRFDEIVQEGPSSIDKFWPQSFSAADYLLQVQAWIALQKRTLDRNFFDLHNLATSGNIEDVKDQLDAHDEYLDIEKYGSETKSTEIANHAKRLGNILVLNLFKQRYGPINKLKNDRDLMKTLVKKLPNVAKYSSDDSFLYTYYAEDLKTRVKRGLKEEISENPFVVRAVYETSIESMLVAMANIDGILRTSKIPNQVKKILPN